MTKNEDRDRFIRARIAYDPDALTRLIRRFEQQWDALSPDEIILAAEIVRLRDRIKELEAR